MTEQGFRFFEHLLFLVRSGDHAPLRMTLGKPLVSTLQKKLEDPTLEKTLFRLDEAIASAPALRFLLHLNLVSVALILGKEAPAALYRFLETRAPRERFLPAEALGAQIWTAVPVAEAIRSHAAVRFWILGWTPHLPGTIQFPCWAEEVVESETRQAIVNAALAALEINICKRNGGFVVFPLCTQEKKKCISGRSLGLPLGMGFSALLNGITTFPLTVVATGALEACGKVRRVGMLDSKAECFSELTGVKAFLYPSENDPPREYPPLEMISVSTLEDALLVQSLYLPGEGARLAEYGRLLRDPEAFVRGCANFPAAWIKWAVLNGHHSRIAEATLSLQHLFEELISRLTTSLKAWDLERSSALASLLDPQLVENVSGSLPLCAFRWFVLNLSLCNHQGEVESARSFAQKAESLIDTIERISPNDAAYYFARQMVAEHNCFQFVPHLSPGLKRTLDLLEKRYASTFPSAGKGFDRALGSLYGTIGQNFAFCGPSFVNKALEYFSKARRVLGEGTVPEYMAEWKRQLHYAAFACLDAGRWEEAEDLICRYLDVPSVSILDPQGISISSPWPHNLLVRFLADVFPEEPSDRYLEWAVGHVEMPPNRTHPWQLWTYNVGRLAARAGRHETARLFFRRSLDLCLASESTVRVMALLPLNGLVALGEPIKTFYEVERELRELARSLNPKHFSPFLDETPLGDPLSEERLAVLFPFTYR